MYRAAHGGDGSVSLSGGDGGDGGVFSLSIHSFIQSVIQFQSKRKIATLGWRSRLPCDCLFSSLSSSAASPTHICAIASFRLGSGKAPLLLPSRLSLLLCGYCMRAAHTQSSLRPCGWRIAILAEENDATAGLRYVLCVYQIE